MKTKPLKISDLEGRPRHEQVQIMSEAMRAIDPAGWDEAAATVRRNVQAALRHAPHLFTRRH